MKTRKTKKVSFFTRFGIFKLTSLVLLLILFVVLTCIDKIQTAAREVDQEIKETGRENIVSSVGTKPNIYGYPEETIFIPFRSK